MIVLCVLFKEWVDCNGKRYLCLNKKFFLLFMNLVTVNAEQFYNVISITNFPLLKKKPCNVPYLEKEGQTI